MSCSLSLSSQNELNALSQYNDTAYFPNAAEWKDVIQEKIQEFFANVVRDALSSFENYIIDFFVAPDKVC